MKLAKLSYGMLCALLAACFCTNVARGAGPIGDHFNPADSSTANSPQVLPEGLPAGYSPQELTFLESINGETVWDEKVKPHLLPADYKEYVFSVNAATPPHRHDEVRKKVANIEFPKGWALLFLKADGDWTFDNKHKEVGKCGPEGFPERGAQGGALCEVGNAKFGQLILCPVDEHGEVPGIIGLVFVPFRGLNKLVYNPLWDMKLLPFMNDLKKHAKFYQNDNEGFIHCRVVVVNPKAKLQ